ncbi:MAG: FAD-dependent oxidoreductase [Acidobacteriota bacterium]
MFSTADAVVIGAGFAGASTAFHLSRLGMGKVVLLEREHSPGLHASGRNAALADPLVADGVLAQLAGEGMRFLQEPPAEFGDGRLLARTGTLRIGTRSDLTALQTKVLEGQGGLAGKLHEVSPVEAGRLVGVLQEARTEAGLYCEWGGVADIHALLRGYVQSFISRGGELKCHAPVVAFRRGSDGTFEIEVAGGVRFQTRAVINAAGAWAGELGRLAGALRMPLTPYRRHLFQSVRLESVDSRWPFVWDETNKFYFRPESGGLLLSPCDGTVHPAKEPAEDPAARLLLAEKLSATIPRLAGLKLSRGWACLRTFASDGRYVIGEDPSLEGFFWAAGLGGSGVLASAGVGRLVAESVVRSEKGVDKMHPLSPSRFLTSG